MRSLVSALAVCLTAQAALFAADAKPIYDSKTVTGKTPGRFAKVDVPLGDAKNLYLVVTDSGDDFACDWADWIEPTLVGPNGEKKLTDLKWKSANSQWGEVNVGKNAGGDALKVAGKALENGIGTHANAVIHFEIPAGYKNFTAKVAVDDGGANQGHGGTVRFLVFTEKPPAALLAGGAGGGGHDLADAVSGLDVADGLEVSLVAGEPTLLSPSNIDVDHLGRIWVCEVVNYRGNQGKRAEGDQILVLEDTDGDGVTDKSTTFYQGHDVDSAHGVCVLGERVIISVGDQVFSLFDRDHDLKADANSKEVMFTGIGGRQHDHGIHSFLFGPDGKLYFNFGNEGRQIRDRNGQPIVDASGYTVEAKRQPYQEGMVFRCDLDGSNLETLGWNFRNNWEVAVDSFGTLWQSDNDDDGNRGVRINFVMEYGNYGYKDEFTGAGWSEKRTNLEEEIPRRHWHLNDPGVVPNLLQTGGGSPTGICVYEGSLLPKQFRNQVIHCDAGPNIVRAYPVEADGAGYKAEMVNILEGTRDKWFRPSDVCVAPDGSLIIADWYDPGVGGHAQRDLDKGRLFRVAPEGAKWSVPKYDFKTVDGAIAALKSPNLAARYLAYRALVAMGPQAVPALKSAFEKDENDRFRARALGVLHRLAGGPQFVTQATQDKDADLRIFGLRLARQIYAPGAGTATLEQLLTTLAGDASPAVRREVAIALHEGTAGQTAPHLHNFPRKAQLWAKLADQYDGKDRWYLEALGIGAGRDWDACLTAWLGSGDKIMTPAGRDIVWRSRGTQTPELLARIIRESNLAADELPRYFRAYDFLNVPTKNAAIVQLAFATTLKDEDARKLLTAEAFNRLPAFDLQKNPEHKEAVEKALAATKGTSQYVTLVDRFNLHDHYGELLSLAQEHADEQVGVDAIKILLNKGQQALVAAALTGEKGVAAAKALGNATDGRAVQLLNDLVAKADAPAELRQEAVRGLVKTKNGAVAIIQRAKQGQLADDLTQTAAFALHASSYNDLKAEAEKLFPLPPSRNDKPLPPLAQLLKSKGNVEEGKKVFAGVGTCAKCHVVNGEGKEVGPNLSEIGSKLSREALFESILYPSAGISHNYETYTAALEDGTVVSGILTSQSSDAITLKGIDALVRTIPRKQVDDLRRQPISLMPADLQKTMTAEELVDVVEYLQTLKKK